MVSKLKRRKSNMLHLVTLTAQNVKILN